jgi:hypothetical protein
MLLRLFNILCRYFRMSDETPRDFFAFALHQDVEANRASPLRFVGIACGFLSCRASPKAHCMLTWLLSDPQGWRSLNHGLGSVASHYELGECWVVYSIAAALHTRHSLELLETPMALCLDCCRRPS